MAWTDEPAVGDGPNERTHGPYDLKIVLTVYNPAASTAEAAAFLADVLLEAGRSNVLARLRSDFGRPWIGTDPRIHEAPKMGPSRWVMRPKLYVMGNLKSNREERAVVQGMYDEAKAALIQVCEANGYMVEEVNHKRFLRD
jgi:hypothetical protein